MKEQTTGKVTLVGAGPGDVGLLTQKGMQAIKEAEVLVYDALLSLELLALCPKEAEWINVGKRSNCHLVPQEEINEILLEKAKEGKNVVRLKGGDPFVFGRGGEELELLAKEGVPFEIVPGITSSIAVAAYNGIPVTHRDYTSSFHVVTGHKKKNGKLDINFKALADMEATLVFLMGVAALETICNRLMEVGMDPDTPAAILEKGTTCRQRRAVATVSTLKAEADKQEIKSPAVIVVGKVCSLERDFSWIEKKPLFGKQILLTRPKVRASEFAEKLRKLGAQVIELPSIDTVPVLAGEREDLKGTFEKEIAAFLEEKGAVCAAFTSPQGVSHFFAQLRELKVDMRKILAPPGLSFAAIGTGTKKELEKYNIFADYVPERYYARELGKLLAEKLTSDTTVYLFRAMQGSPELTEELKKAKLSYKDVAIYETVYKSNPMLTEKLETAFAQEDIDYVTFTSASTVKGFAETLKNIDFTKVCAVCIGEQTAKEAEKYGMKIEIAKEPSIASMIELLCEKAGRNLGWN